MKHKNIESLVEEKSHDPYKLPGGWKLVKLGDVTQINPSKKEISGLPIDLEVSFVPMEFVNEISGSILRQEIRKIEEVKKGYTYFKEGDILFAKITPCMENGKCAIAKGLVNGLGFGSTEFHVVRTGGDITPEWIYLFLRQESLRNEAKKYFTGAVGQQRVPEDFLKSLKLPIPFKNGKPDLEEQKRILAKIEALFEKLDRAKGLRSQAKKEAEELLQSALYEIFSEADEEGWKWVKLGEILSIEYGKRVENEHRRDDGEYWAYGSNGQIYRVKTFLIEPPALIIGRKGSVGAINLIKERFWPIDTTFYAKIKLPSYSIDFIYWTLSYFNLSKLTITTTKPGLNREDLKSFKLPIPFRNGKPDLEEQKRIVVYLDKIDEKQKELLKLYGDSENEIEEMKQAILQKAFRGELL